MQHSKQDNELAAEAMDTCAKDARDLEELCRGRIIQGDAVEQDCWNRAAKVFSDLAVYYAGRAAGYRQSL